MKADNIVDQHASGLLTRREAIDMLTTLQGQSKFNADYADHVDSFNRWTAEGTAARAALIAL